MAQSYDEVRKSLTEIQKSYELSIIKISEPISGAINQSSTTRTSDVSADAFDSPSPASLEADLSHYKVRRASVAQMMTILIRHRSYSQNYASLT
jgi:hypothetical protein